MLERRQRDTPPRRPLGRSRWLWAVGAVLATLTIVHAVLIVHDTSRERLAVRLAAHAAAERVAGHAGAVLDLLALETFAPVSPWMPSAAAAPAAAARLARWQEEGLRCRCRELLPAVAFLSYSAGADTLIVVALPGAADSALPDRAMLRRVAAAELERARGLRRSRSHLTAGRDLGGWSVLSMVQMDSAGAPAAVYGLVANARETLLRLFGSPDHRGGRRPGAAAPELDARAVLIAAADSTPLFGGPDEDRITATIRPQGPLEGLTLGAALTAEHVLSVHPVGPRRQVLWALGVLLASTIFVFAVAVFSLRREAELAGARSDFIAGVSHDLRMPLAQVLLATETLTEGRARDDVERRSLLTSILRETRRLVGLVENVIFVSRAGRVGLRPELGPVAVADLFTDVIESVALAAEDAGHRIEVTPASPDRTPLAVRGDSRLLRQALVNLVDNALKYGAGGQTIRLAAEPAGSARVRISVADQGPGLPPELRTRVFEPYHRLARDQASERTGAGLGLTVVRQIVEACGGRVWLDEAPGGGALAIVELDRAERPG